MQSTTFKGRATCAGTTGNPAVSLRAAIVTGALHNSSPVTCNDVLGVPTSGVSAASVQLGASTLDSQPLIEGRVRWKAPGGRLLDSQISFDSYALASGVFSVPYPGGSAGVLVGSYSGEQLSSTATGLRLTGRCNRNGIKVMSFEIAGFTIQP